MNSDTRTIGALAVSAGLALAFMACGGGDDSGGADDSGMMATGGTGPGNMGGTSVPASCTAPDGCPAGYVCVPKNPPMFVAMVDEACVASCTPPCDLAGPLKDMCVQSCREACTTQQPVAGSDMTGTCQVASSSGGTGGNVGLTGQGGIGQGGSPGGMGGGSGTQIDWNATWSAELSYTAKCSFGGAAMQMRTHKHTVTMKISSTGDSSKGEVAGGYELVGPKGSGSLTLSGDLPMKSHNGGVASRHSLNSPNEITLKLTNVESGNKATGTMEGSWEASGGWKCAVAAGGIAISK